MKKFFDALDALSEENKVEKEKLIEGISKAITLAAKKTYPYSEERIQVDINPAKKKFSVYINQKVVEDYPIDDTEINIDAARLIDPKAVVGGTIRKPLDISLIGRSAATTAKQAIKSDLREINKEQILTKFERLENDCITADVTQVEPGKGTVTIVYDDTELYLFKNEQIPGETLVEGQKIKVYITKIANKQKKPIIKISRTHKDLVKRLFESEVPEIKDGIVEIKSISREAGSRTKIAVWSNNPDVDAVGACIGSKQSRILSIVKELNGEKIDIIPWSASSEEYITKALAPAQVLKTIVTSESESDRTCTVIVPNSQLSLAIGNKGQNAKLAAKLVGFKIDIKPQIDPLTNEEAPELKADFAVPAAENDECAAAEETAETEITEETAEISAEETETASEEETAAENSGE